jgi:serine/threonine-protein kinase
MKLVKGRRLDQYAAEAVALPERLRTFQKICEAVAFAHAHEVLHRDLKPQNIMVGRFGEVLVMDWGLAKLLSPVKVAGEDSGKIGAPRDSAASTATGHGSVLGTPGYMAPEQARGEIAATGPLSDVYSLGAVLNFLLEAAGPAPKALSAIAGKATADDPVRRYGSVQDMSDDVAHYLDGLPVGAYPEGGIARAWRWVVRNRAWILLIAAYLAMRSLFILWRGR